jgi:hypothetical protein
MASPSPAAQQSGLPYNIGVILDPSNHGAPSASFAQPWFYLFQQFYRLLGGSANTPQNALFAQLTAPTVVTFYSCSTGAAVGTVTITPV